MLEWFLHVLFSFANNSQSHDSYLYMQTSVWVVTMSFFRFVVDFTAPTTFLVVKTWNNWQLIDNCCWFLKPIALFCKQCVHAEYTQNLQRLLKFQWTVTILMIPLGSGNHNQDKVLLEVHPLHVIPMEYHWSKLMQSKCSPILNFLVSSGERQRQHQFIDTINSKGGTVTIRSPNLDGYSSNKTSRWSYWPFRMDWGGSRFFWEHSKLQRTFLIRPAFLGSSRSRCQAEKATGREGEGPDRRTGGIASLSEQIKGTEVGVQLREGQTDSGLSPVRWNHFGQTRRNSKFTCDKSSSHRQPRGWEAGPHAENTAGELSVMNGPGNFWQLI